MEVCASVLVRVNFRLAGNSLLCLKSNSDRRMVLTSARPLRSRAKYSVVLEANGQEQLIFKHAISTVVMGRVVSTHPAHAPHQEKAANGPIAAVTAASASGTEG